MRARNGFLAAVILAAVGLPACATPVDAPDGPGSSAGEAHDGVTPTPPAATTSAPGGTPPAEPATIANGRHPAYLTAIDTAKRTVTFDLILFLGGEQARKEWARQHPEDPEGPPNDYLIVNNNARLRTLVVEPDVTVKVLDLNHLPQTVSMPFAGLPAYFAKPGFDHDTYLSSVPFWLTVVKGTVVAFEEQYLP